MGYIPISLIVVACIAFFIYKRGWKFITMADISGICYVVALAIIIVSQGMYIETLEKKVKIGEENNKQQMQMISKLADSVHEFFSAIKQEKGWQDVAPNITLPEYLEASQAKEQDTIVATGTLLKIKD